MNNFLSPVALVILTVALTSGAPAPVRAALAVASLRCEYQVNPLGIDTTRPRLSWRLVTDRRATLQSAYRIQAARNPGLLQEGHDLLWDSGRVGSDQ